MLKAQKKKMGLKEIEEKVVERCRVGFRKLRSARRVTVFWCFDVLMFWWNEIFIRDWH